MHAILVTLGTDGDVFPYLGLGAVLRGRGHRVTLVSGENYREAADRHGFAFRPLFPAGEFERLLAHPDFWHPIWAGGLLIDWGVQYFDQQYTLLSELAGDSDAILVANPGIFAARFVQEKLGRPMATLLLQPGMIPSGSAPPVMPGVSLPRGAPWPIGHLYWQAFYAVTDLLLARHINRFRGRLALKPIRQVFRWWLSPELVIGMFPDWYAPPQKDWPSQIKLAGFPLYDGTSDRTLPAEVQEFCRAGPPPVAFTFGTGMMHATRLFRAAAEACERSGMRGLLLTKYPHQMPARLPSGVRHCAFAPFQQLLPHCAAVVHHGGIGTVARALTEGVPQIIIPFAFDQPDNAEHVRQLGVGKGLSRRQRSGAHLAKALASVVTSRVQARCKTLSSGVRHDAFDQASRWIEALQSRF